MLRIIITEICQKILIMLSRTPDFFHNYYKIYQKSGVNIFTFWTSNFHFFASLGNYVVCLTLFPDFKLYSPKCWTSQAQLFLNRSKSRSFVVTARHIWPTCYATHQWQHFENSCGLSWVYMAQWQMVFFSLSHSFISVPASHATIQIPDSPHGCPCCSVKYT